MYLLYQDLQIMIEELRIDTGIRKTFLGWKANQPRGLERLETLPIQHLKGTKYIEQLLRGGHTVSRQVTLNLL